MIKKEEDKNSEAFRVQHKVVPRDIEKEMKQSFIEYAMSVIRQLATVSRRVSPMNSADRRYLHLAAVFACNFTNHCIFRT